MYTNMRLLSKEEADIYLSTIGFKIGFWNRIEYKEQPTQRKISTVQFHPPKNGRELLNFSQCIAGWIPQGDWKIFQIDNSTFLDPIEADFLSRILGEKVDIDRHVSVLFDFEGDQVERFTTELTIANVIFSFLLFQCHGFLVSSNNTSLQCLSLQDGVVYFSSTENNAQSLIDSFSLNPLNCPAWILSAKEILENS